MSTVIAEPEASIAEPWANAQTATEPPRSNSEILEDAFKTYRELSAARAAKRETRIKALSPKSSNGEIFVAVFAP